MSTAPDRFSVAGPPRDFVGYGRDPPQFRWPDGSAVAISIVLNYEEGAEYSLLDGDPINDAWGETATAVPPPVRDMGSETHYESAAASASGGSRGSSRSSGSRSRSTRPRSRWSATPSSRPGCATARTR